MKLNTIMTSEHNISDDVQLNVGQQLNVSK